MALDATAAPSPLVDVSQPVSSVLRLATQAAHSQAEHSQGAHWLARGELDKEEYARFMIMLWWVYSTLEDALGKHASNSVLAPTYDPVQLARTERIQDDVAYLLESIHVGAENSNSGAELDPLPSSVLPMPSRKPSWLSHPICRSLWTAPPPALVDYVTRLRSIADCDADAPLLLAHAYVRYLGDLSGGQVIRRRVGKAYGLDGESGLSFFTFSAPAGTGFSSTDGAATLGDMKRIKERYRAGMDEGVGDDAELKTRLAQEANVAFTLNTGLFDALRPPTTHASTEVSDGSSEKAQPSSSGADLLSATPTTLSTDKKYGAGFGGWLADLIHRVVSVDA